LDKLENYSSKKHFQNSSFDFSWKIAISVFLVVSSFVIGIIIYRKRKKI
jgi:peptidoglycan/LPS O-acetylase OafA/YrhL